MKFKHLNRLKCLNEEQYTVQPKTKEELIKIIKDTIENEGNECDLNFIDTSKITDMSMLFWNAKCMDFKGDVSKWDTSNVTNMAGLFWGCTRFNCDVSKWNTSKVKTMSEMFYECNKFNQPLNKWDVSNVENFSDMFKMCWVFNQPLNNWNMRKARNISGMFYECSNFNQDLDGWNTSNVETCVSILNKVPYTHALTNWDLSSIDKWGVRFIFSRMANSEAVKWTKEAWLEQLKEKFKFSDVERIRREFVDR